MVDVNAYITTRHLLNKYILPIFWSYQFNSIHVNTFSMPQNKHKTNTKQTQNKHKTKTNTLYFHIYWNRVL